MSPEIQQLVLGMHAAGMIRFGDFVLKSGRSSPVYIDLRTLPWWPPLLKCVAVEMNIVWTHPLLGYTGSSLTGLPMSGLPIAVAMGLGNCTSVGYPRPHVKDYGTKKALEGNYLPGQSTIVVDDLITDGGAKLEALKPLREAGICIKAVLVVLDREQGGREALRREGIPLHSLFTMKEALWLLRVQSKITDGLFETVSRYLQAEKASAV